MGFVFVFDIPESEATEKVRINRELHRAQAKMLQNSLWVHDDLKKLVEFATRIKRIGGKASILEEKFIF